MKGFWHISRQQSVLALQKARDASGREQRAAVKQRVKLKSQQEAANILIFLHAMTWFGAARLAAGATFSPPAASGSHKQDLRSNVGSMRVWEELQLKSSSYVAILQQLVLGKKRLVQQRKAGFLRGLWDIAAPRTAVRSALQIIS